MSLLVVTEPVQKVGKDDQLSQQENHVHPLDVMLV